MQLDSVQCPDSSSEAVVHLFLSLRESHLELSSLHSATMWKETHIKETVRKKGRPG